MSAPTEQDLPPLLTADQVVEQFRSIGRHRLYQLVRRGEIPVVRLGGRAYRFSLPALNAWLEAGGTPSPAEMGPAPSQGSDQPEPANAPSCADMEPG